MSGSAARKSSESFEVMEQLKEMTQLEWFWLYGNNGVLSTWLHKYNVPYSLILTRWGICFNFNMITTEELLNVNETSRDFHYNADIVNFVFVASLDSNAIDFDAPFPWHAASNHRTLINYFFNGIYNNGNPLVEQDGYHIIFHSNFEFPFAEEKNHIWIGTQQFVTIDIDPVVYEADDSMSEMKVVE